MKPMTYAGAGVRYDSLDPFKLEAQHAALLTAGNIANFRGGMFKEFGPSRGGSSYLIETPDSFFALVEEGLGTKNKVADAMLQLTGISYHGNTAQCTVAMIVNDMITSGALPLSVAMHAAVGDADWFNDSYRAHKLIEGWKHACDLARCTWGCGETPALPGLIYPGAMVLSGSSIGVINPKDRRILGDIQEGDAIIFIESSGIHANGLTLARKIADREDGFWRKLLSLLLPETFPSKALPKGYLTCLSDGRTYGETLLTPTHIYVGVVADCLEAGIPIHAAENITGHGLRKLMRSVIPFTYVIDTLPRKQPVFDFIEQHGPVDKREMYGNFNMGAGFALFVAEKNVKKTLEVIYANHHKGFVAGYVEKGQKRVIIRPENLEFQGETLAIR